MEIRKNRLSVALATYNEEQNLDRCLESVRLLTEEIVIVDGSSTDKTVEIAKKYGAKILIKNNPPIFHINKQKALEMCTGDWILQLDADESVSPELADEIKNVTSLSEADLKNRKLESPDARLFIRHQKLLEERDGVVGKTGGPISAFFLPRKNYFLGKFLRYGGVYPDGVIRLVKNGKARFPCKSVHEQIEIDGRVGWLENSLYHYDSPNLKRYLIRADKYTNLTANQFVKDDLPINMGNTVNYLMVKPIKTFLMMSIRHKGILDGWQGIAFAFFSGLHFPVAYLKYWRKKP